MLKTNEFCVKSLFKIVSNNRHNLWIKRWLAKKISRGQDPEEVAAMPVLQFTATDRAPKQRKQIYFWGYSGGGATGRLSLIKRAKFKGRPVAPPIEIRRAPMKSDFVDLQTNVMDVAAGFGFTVIAAVVKDSSHRLFGCGVNTDSQIGYQMPPTPKGQPLMCVFKPVPIMLPIKEDDRVVRVSCGRAHTVCLTNTGQIYSLGNNSFGQCGRPVIADEVYFASRRIHQIESIDEKVIQVVCGQDHTLFLTENGSVYSCGWGADGQTGLGHYKNQGIPVRVKGDIEGENITQLSSAADCALAVNEKGDVFGWGNSEYSQFECITKDKQMNVPKRLHLKSVSGKVVNVAAGGSLCALVNDSGNVYVWGYGILGLGPKVEHLRNPVMLPMPLFGANEFNSDVKVVRVEASFSHLAAITNKGELFMWGKNTKACLGLGHEADQYFPFRVCIPTIVRKVSLGIDHTVVIGTTI